ncbi:MAG: L-threonylcarbamoyladenylate synthase, partial [Oscillospiraceae bacterium]
MKYNTEILKDTDDNATKKAAELLKQGDIVGIPTETVYGLAANALDPKAVEKIFIAKGRPADNPLIVHVNNIEMIKNLVDEIPLKAISLFEKFSPGPLTIILKKSDIIPNIVSANLKTVAIRIPLHAGARKIIEKTNLPLAAPSANTSGKPSPTSANTVFDDMNGKIPLIIDGGICDVGVESTVISLAEKEPLLLRPGFITQNDIEKVIGKIKLSTGVLSQINDNTKVISPGMKYKHYSPQCDVIIIDSSFD